MSATKPDFNDSGVSSQASVLHFYFLRIQFKSFIIILQHALTGLRRQVHDVKILEGLSTLHQTRELQRDAMHMVRHLQARIEVKKEVMEEQQNEHVRRHVELQSVVEAKISEATELRGLLNDIELALECGCCFKKLGSGSVSLGAGTPTATGLRVRLVWQTRVRSAGSQSLLE